MPRSPEQRIDDILRCCEKILRFTAGMAREQLSEQELVMDAVLRNLEIFGEATKHLPDHVRAAMPGIAWKEIAGMRDWISHVYDRVDDEVVWNAIEVDLPLLLHTLQVHRGIGRS